MGTAAHGLRPIRKNEHVLALLPKALAKEPKVTERHLEEEGMEKARMARIVDTPNVERNPLPSLLELHHPRARKTGNLAGITLWDLAVRALIATTGIHQYADIGARALALMTKSAPSSIERGLSKSAKRKAQHQRRPILKLEQKLEQKRKLESERHTFKPTVLVLLLRLLFQIRLPALLVH